MINQQMFSIKRAIDEFPGHQDGRDGEHGPHPLSVVRPRTVGPHPKEYMKVFVIMPSFEEKGQTGRQAGGVVLHQRFGIVRIEQFERFDDQVKEQQPTQPDVENVGSLQRSFVVDGRFLGIFPIVNFASDPPPVAHHPNDHRHTNEYIVRRPVVQ